MSLLNRKNRRKVKLKGIATILGENSKVVIKTDKDGVRKIKIKGKKGKEKTKYQ
tara:strand:- start:61 stop:222 length:162 start_codon:yes stop_codon:yes gene_type:complete